MEGLRVVVLVGKQVAEASQNARIGRYGAVQNLEPLGRLHVIVHLLKTDALPTNHQIKTNKRSKQTTELHSYFPTRLMKVNQNG